MIPQPVLDQCSQEPIHLCGALQPHGVLLSVTLEDWTIAHASANADSMFGIAVEDMVGMALSALLDAEASTALRNAAATMASGQPPVPVVSTNLGPYGAIHELGLHVSQGFAHIEFEAQGNDRRSAQELSQKMVIALTSTVQETLLDVVAHEVRQLTGYDRVMVYRFLEDLSGEVASESRADGVPSYLGLRFPATDIPAQARELYVRNRVRIIPDIHYAPQPLVPQHTQDGTEVDLGQAYLRSVSPVHLQYLANMGVAASMSISIVCEGRLWGLIACHHLEPRAVSPASRRAAYLFGLFVSLRVESEELRRTSRLAAKLRDELPFLKPSSTRSTRQLGEREIAAIRKAFGTQSACWIDTTADVGQQGILSADAQKHVSKLLGEVHDNLFWTDARADWTTDVGCPYAGLLAIRMVRNQWLLLLRRERVTEVTWAGRPDAPFQREGALKIGPRTSFQAWTQKVAGHSRPWSTAEINVAFDVHRHFAQSQALPGTGGVSGNALASNEDQFGCDEGESRAP